MIRFFFDLLHFSTGCCDTKKVQNIYSFWFLKYDHFATKTNFLWSSVLKLFEYRNPDNHDWKYFFSDFPFLSYRFGIQTGREKPCLKIFILTFHSFLFAYVTKKKNNNKLINFFILNSILLYTELENFISKIKFLSIECNKNLFC